MLTRRSPTHVARLCVRPRRWEPPSSISGNGNRIWQDMGCLLCSNRTFSKVDQNLSVSGENWVYLKQDFQTLRVISFWMISRFGKASGVWTNPKVSFIYWCQASVSARQEMKVCRARNLAFKGGGKRKRGRHEKRKETGLSDCDELVSSLVWTRHASQRKVIYLQDNQKEKTERESG